MTLIFVFYCNLLIFIIDGRLLVEWKSVTNQSLDHSGSLCLQWLKDNCYAGNALTRKVQDMEPVIGTEVSWESLPSPYTYAQNE